MQALALFLLPLDPICALHFTLPCNGGFRCFWRCCQPLKAAWYKCELKRSLQSLTAIADKSWEFSSTHRAAAAVNGLQGCTLVHSWPAWVPRANSVFNHSHSCTGSLLQHGKNKMFGRCWTLLLAAALICIAGYDTLFCITGWRLFLSPIASLIVFSDCVSI